MAIYKDGQKIRQIAYQEEATGKAINISEVWFSDGIYDLTDADDNMPLLDDDGEAFQDDSQNYPLLIFQYDIDAPELTVTTPAGMVNTSPSYTASASYLVSGTVTDADSGVKTVYVNGNEAVISGTAWSYTINLNADTATAVSVYAIDNAGNITETIVRYVMYDATAPALVVNNPSATSSASPTYQTTSSLTVSGTASDSGSGIKNVTVNGYTASGTTSWSYTLTLSGNTTTTITVVATDNAGRTTTVTRYAMYDSAAPTLSVTAPTSTSSSSPTYVQNDSAYTYTVSGTASDSGSGVKSVTVNGYTASGTTSWSYALSCSVNTTTTITIIATDNAGRTTTATRYLRIEAYYQYAARLAGATVQSSLANTLTNSSVCESIADNSSARTVMTDNYKSTMLSYIDNTSNWNVGLNYLNYKCQLKTYLFHAGNVCTLVTGGWGGSITANAGANASSSSAYTKGTTSTGYLYTELQAGHSGRACNYLKTTNSINRSGYSKVGLSGTTVYGHPSYSYQNSTSITEYYDDIAGSGSASPTSFPTWVSGNTPISIFTYYNTSTSSVSTTRFWKVQYMYLE